LRIKPYLFPDARQKEKWSPWVPIYKSEPIGSIINLGAIAPVFNLGAMAPISVTSPKRFEPNFNPWLNKDRKTKAIFF
jgi:hypothetical protein